MGKLYKTIDATTGIVEFSSANSVRVTRRAGDTDITGTASSNTVVNMAANGTTTAGFTFTVPEGYDNTQDPTFVARGYTSGTGTSEDYRMQLEFESGALPFVVDGVADDTIVWTNAAPDADEMLFEMDTQTISQSTLSLEAGDELLVLFSRVGGDAADDRGGSYRWLTCYVEFPLTDYKITT